MKQIASLLNEMVDAGVITNYALFGALAQMRYTEPVGTLDADVLVGVPSPERYCAKKGFSPEGEAVRVGEWRVQFIPVFSALTQEAMEQAEVADFEGVPLRVVSADHLAVIALSVGRAKDLTRILALIESGSTTPEAVAALAARHDLADAWATFRQRFPDE